MKIIDAHIHLSEVEYTGHLSEVIADATTNGVSALITSSVNLKTCKNDVKLAEQYPNLIYSALGIQPYNVNFLKHDELHETIDFILQQSQKKRPVAIGEIGLDYKYETSWEKQLFVFDKMLHLAEQLELPVVIHSRGTTDKIVEILQSYSVKRVLLHWFNSTIDMLSKIVDLGYFISEGPPVVYSGDIREIVKQTPITNLLTETDGPVLYRKRPFNGQLTKPSHIRTVLETISEIKNVAVPDVAEQVAQNSEKFFNIKF
ncbi:MAG: TatD family hydrolase [Nitrososphaerota archaeon]|nr:TatD family hydrolase [Nitrososphaerota archaeon]